jgi:putative spermidine/putrescine transport system permease protein
MADVSVGREVMVAEDGVSLTARLARATRRQKSRALLFIAPLFLFVLVTFLYPIGLMLLRSVYSPEFRQIMHRTAAMLSEWDGAGLPPEPAWKALAEDLAESSANKTIGKAATVINFEMPAVRSLFTKTARRADGIKQGPSREAILAIDGGWEKPEIWTLMKRLSSPVTGRFYVNALDLTYNEHGQVVAQHESRRIYVPLFWRTFWISGAVTLACLLLGYPVAYLLSTLPLRYSNLLMIFVLLPFWTSLLVRTTAWIALLQNQGVINSLLVWLGVIPEHARIQMIFNATGTFIAMTHMLLPFMILPLYSVMKTIPPSYMRAARSLGADQFTAFTRVYMPMTIPGVAAGCILVFILAIGYYITPALVGGQTGMLISNLIAYHMRQSLNWSLAAALAALLLASVLLLYWVYNRLIGVHRIKFG